jgi:tetratricopeptide (TPR) repeat protein
MTVDSCSRKVLLSSRPAQFLRSRNLTFLLLAGLALAAPKPLLHGQTTPAPRASDRPFFFRAVNYDVQATLDPERHLLTAVVRADFEAVQPARTLDVELNSNLTLGKVYGADQQPLPFERVALSDRITIALPATLNVGDKTTLTFEYAGPLADNETVLAGGTRLAYIGPEGAYLLLAARWFPLTRYPANRYTGRFAITAPERFEVFGTGAGSPREQAMAALAAEPQPQTPPQPQRPARGRRPQPAAPPAPARQPIPGHYTHVFTVEKPEAAGTFVAGALQPVLVSAEGVPVTVVLPVGKTDTASAYGEAVARAVTYFSDALGPLASPSLTLAQLPNVPSVPRGDSSPGFLLVSARQWSAEVNDRLLARLVAEQWWGNAIRPASANDLWLSDGLSRYSEGLYVKNLSGEEGFRRALEDFAVGALMYEDSAAIGQASRLKPYTPEYRAVVEDKGASVFHMLRGQMGDAAFDSLLRDYYARFAGKSAAIAEFQALAQEKANAAAGNGAPLNLTPFFVQWMNSTGIPDFRLEYEVFRTRKGFRIDGRVKQDLETFRMRVGVKVETDGNPEEALIDVVGTESSFSIETFGRPKPGGITLDPHNHLLKSNPQLRVKAAIRRGEAYAEEGRFYEAIQEYQVALERQKNSSLAHFRMAEAFFYQKNYQAAAQAFRDAIDGDRDPKWIEVWSHIYLGKIFDVTGQRERALNEYEKARETNDDTGGAQAEAEKYIREPYTEPTRPGS